MDIETIRGICLSLPNVTEDVKWGADLCFLIGGKMFAVINLNPPNEFSLKVTPQEFAELTQREGIKPADYVARYHWITVLDHDVLRKSELEHYIKSSYEMVRQKLPRKIQAGLETMKMKSIKPSALRNTTTKILKKPQN